MGPRPSAKHSVDRYPNGNGNYEPGNVRWATMKEQGRNRPGHNIVLDFRGQKRTVSEWAELLCLKAHLVYERLKAGWSAERALTEPARLGRKGRPVSDALREKYSLARKAWWERKRSQEAIRVR